MNWTAKPNLAHINLCVWLTMHHDLIMNLPKNLPNAKYLQKAHVFYVDLMVLTAESLLLNIWTTFASYIHKISHYIHHKNKISHYIHHKTLLLPIWTNTFTNETNTCFATKSVIHSIPAVLCKSWNKIKETTRLERIRKLASMIFQPKRLPTSWNNPKLPRKTSCNLQHSCFILSQLWPILLINWYVQSIILHLCTK